MQTRIRCGAAHTSDQHAHEEDNEAHAATDFVCRIATSSQKPTNSNWILNVSSTFLATCDPRMFQSYVVKELLDGTFETDYKVECCRQGSVEVDLAANG